MAAISDGSTGYYLYNSSTPPIVNVPFTISMWLKASALTTDMYVIDIDDDTDSSFFRGYIRGTSTGQVRAQKSASGGSQANATGEDFPDTTTWHHVLFSSASTTDLISVLDGDYTNRGTNAGSITMSDLDTLNLFSNSAGGSRYNGMMADVCIWDKALSQSEIESLWTSSETGPAANTVAVANVVAYYPMTAATTVNDQVGTYHLTNNGSNITFSDADNPTITGGGSTGTPLYYYRMMNQ